MVGRSGRAMESYKLAAMGATLNGNSLVFSECGAESSAAPSAPPSRARRSPPSPAPAFKDQGLLSIVYRAFAGGVTRPIWHTYGETDNLSTSIFGDPTLQPAPGPYSVAEALSPLSPNWGDQVEANTLLGRLGYVLRQGQPRFDIGVYQGTLGNDDAGPGAALTADEPIGTAGRMTCSYLNKDALQRAGARGPRRRPVPRPLPLQSVRRRAGRCCSPAVRGHSGASRG